MNSPMFSQGIPMNQNSQGIPMYQNSSGFPQGIPMYQYQSGVAGVRGPTSNSNFQPQHIQQNGGYFSSGSSTNSNGGASTSAQAHFTGAFDMPYMIPGYNCI